MVHFKIMALVAALSFGLLPIGAVHADLMPVDLELVMAVDVSGSVDVEEARLQRGGYITAFRDPEVVRVIQAGMLGRIAVLYTEWASAHENRLVIDWHLISD